MFIGNSFMVMIEVLGVNAGPSERNKMTTEISPTNNPSPTSHIVAEGHGDSYDTTFNDEPARIGSIEPNVTIAEYTVHSPKVLYATSGAVGINDRNHNTGTFFTIPIGNVHLETGVSGLRYISRKVSPEVTEETIKQLTYLRENGIGDDTWFSLPRSEQFARLWSVVGDTGMQEIILPNEKPAYIKRELDNPSGSH